MEKIALILLIIITSCNNDKKAITKETFVLKIFNKMEIIHQYDIKNKDTTVYIPANEIFAICKNGKIELMCYSSLYDKGKEYSPKSDFIMVFYKSRYNKELYIKSYDNSDLIKEQIVNSNQEKDIDFHEYDDITLYSNRKKGFNLTMYYDSYDSDGIATGSSTRSYDYFGDYNQSFESN